MLTVVQLGAGEPSTILGGVRELVSDGMYPLAALVFFASILVPGLKLVGLTIMLVTTQTGRIGRLRDRTRLYHIVRFIGRWSMIDIFMELLLGALVAFGSVDHNSARHGRAGVLRRRDPDDVRRRDIRSAADVGRRGRGRGEGGLIVADGPAWTTAILSVMTEQAPAARGSCVLDQDRRSCWHAYSNMRGLVE